MGTSRGLSREQQRIETHTRLLEEGVRWMTRHQQSDPTAGIRIVDVTFPTGLSTGAFYNHFDGLDEYRRELLTYVLDAERMSRIQTDTLDRLAAAVERGAKFDEVVRIGADENFRGILRSDVFALTLAVWPLARQDDEIRALLAEQYRVSNAEYAETYVAIMDHYGLEFRDATMNAEWLAVVLNAIVEGLVLRAVIDRDAVGVDSDDRSTMFADTIVPLLTAITQPRTRVGRDG